MGCVVGWVVGTWWRCITENYSLHIYVRNKAILQNLYSKISNKGPVSNGVMDKFRLVRIPTGKTSAQKGKNSEQIRNFYLSGLTIYSFFSEFLHNSISTEIIPPKKLKIPTECMEGGWFDSPPLIRVNPSIPRGGSIDPLRFFYLRINLCASIYTIFADIS